MDSSLSVESSSLSGSMLFLVPFHFSPRRLVFRVVLVATPLLFWV
jgi:hypothetical protein